MKAILIASLLLSVFYYSAAQVTTATGTTWTVPGTYSYTVPPNTARIGVSCIGASGGDNYYLANGGGSQAGKGASAYAEFYVNPGKVLTVIVGGKGQDANGGSYSDGAGGGGGGSFVFDPANAQTLQYPYVAAGGGGGSSALTLGGTNYYGSSAGITANGYATLDGAGDAPPVPGYSSTGSGGKGWIEIRYNAIGGSSTNNYANGGWGGGGANMGQAAGGGGGYTGGPAGSTSGVGSAGKVGGGGGGSFTHPTLANRPLIQAQSSSGNGQVIISTRISCLNGGFLNVVNASCVCPSGYKGISCELVPGCQGQATSDNGTNAYPQVSTDPTLTLFTGNALQITMKGPYVLNRKYTSLTFNGGNQISTSCALQGANSWWVKGFNDGWECADTLTLTLPWRNHTACGFVTTDNTNYVSTLALTYTEDTGDHFGLDVIRTVTHSYTLSIAFPKNIQATISGININSVVLFDAVLVGENYDYQHQYMVLTFNAISPWSSRLVGQSPVLDVVVPQNMSLLQAPAVTDVSCVSTVPGSNCIQQFSLIVKLQNDSLCTYNGQFKINGTIASCRENYGLACNTAPISMYFTLTSGSVCASVSVAPTITSSLQVAHTLDFSDPNNLDNFNYKLGQQAYFSVNVDGGSGNSVGIIFNSISYIDSNNTASPLYTAAGGMTPAGTSSKLSLMPAAKYFSMYFSGAVFNIPFGSTWNYSIQAACSVQYDGNRKRDVLTTWSATEVNPSVRFSLQGVQHAAIKDDELDAVFLEQNDNTIGGISLSSAIGIAAAGVVTGLAAVLVVVVVVFKKLTARLQAEKAATPLLASSL